MRGAFEDIQTIWVCAGWWAEPRRQDQVARTTVSEVARSGWRGAPTDVRVGSKSEELRLGKRARRDGRSVPVYIVSFGVGPA